MDACLRKPIRRRELLDTIAALNLSTIKVAREEGKPIAPDDNDVASTWDPEAALASVDGDHELLQMVIQAFLGESERLMNQIHQAISQHDLGELRRASHTLKGSTRIFGDTMANQVALARRASELGFAALWFRDVPLLDPRFGDAGQIYDPWTYLGFIAARTRDIALATGSIVLPLRHPLHVAKAAASVDVLSGGRMVLGVATGDRPIEFPAFGRPFETRGEAYLREFWANPGAFHPGQRIMPAFGLTKSETDNLFAFLEWVGEQTPAQNWPPRPILVSGGSPLGGAVNTTSASAGTLPDDPVERGKHWFSSPPAICSTCHSLEPDIVIVGPSLAGVTTRAETRISGMTAQQYLRDSIINPGDFVVPGFPDAMQRVFRHWGSRWEGGGGAGARREGNVRLFHANCKGRT